MLNLMTIHIFVEFPNPKTNLQMKSEKQRLRIFLISKTQNEILDFSPYFFGVLIGAESFYREKSLCAFLKSSSSFEFSLRKSEFQMIQ